MSFTERVAQIQFQHKLRLPAAYKAFLETHEDRVAYSFFGFPGETWHLYTAPELVSPVSRIEPRPLNFEFVAKTGGWSLRGAITIGRENTTQLYIDTKKGGSIWVYHIDDETTERIADTFDQWLSKAKRV